MRSAQPDIEFRQIVSAPHPIKPSYSAWANTPAGQKFLMQYPDYSASDNRLPIVDLEHHRKLDADARAAGLTTGFVQKMAG